MFLHKNIAKVPEQIITDKHILFVDMDNHIPIYFYLLPTQLYDCLFPRGFEIIDHTVFIKRSEDNELGDLSECEDCYSSDSEPLSYYMDGIVLLNCSEYVNFNNSSDTVADYLEDEDEDEEEEIEEEVSDEEYDIGARKYVLDSLLQSLDILINLNKISITKKYTSLIRRIKKIIADLEVIK